ncbi:hypothetical protein NMG60_11025596 [Bertholletia excelsa]
MKKETQYWISLILKCISRRNAIQQIHTQVLVHGFRSISASPLWSSLLRHYSLGSFPQEAIFLFKHLQSLYPPFCFDTFFHSFLIKASANLQSPTLGAQFHGLTLKSGHRFHLYPQTALVNMYSVCGCLVDAHQVFNEMPDRNSVTWNALISGFMKRGELRMARSLFDQMPTRNVVSWTAVIDGYKRMNQPEEALLLFRGMLVENGIKPTHVTILVILSAISMVGYLEFCQSIHTYGEKAGFIKSDIRVADSLIITYAKCGCIEVAIKVFESISHVERTLVTWTSMISVYAMHGMGKQAAEGFKRMGEKGLKPNRLTFLSIFNACSHAGLVEEGLEFFRIMVDECQIAPDIKHYGCLIDMLGRAGRLEEAEKMASQVPPEIANVVIWRTLLGACSFHGNIEMGNRAMRKILDLEKSYGGDYVLLHNMFAGFGRFEAAESVRRLMYKNKASKVPGLSSV